MQRSLLQSATDAICTCVWGLSGCGYETPEYTYIDSDDSRKWIAIAYATCVFVAFAFAAYAVLRYTLRMMRLKHDYRTAEEFTTARGTAGPWYIAWSFFASVVGAWCISAPGYFAVNTGILGLASYAVSSGLPILVLAFCGAHILRRHPNVVSVSDFASRRFGPTMKLITSLICLFNMGIALLSEYTTIGSLFADFVGSEAWPMIITVGILTMAYTIYGGLYISIITDQVQGIATVLFILVLTIYVAVTFRPDLPKPLPNDLTFYTDPDTGYQNFPLGFNELGYSTLFSMPCALMASTVFSEAVWQKVWASESRGSLIFGGSVAFVGITIAVFLFGLGGWLAAWGGYVSFNTNTNLYLFQVFNSQRVAAPPSDGTPALQYDPAYSARLNSWVGAVTLILAITMNEGLIDSMQNGLTSVVANHWFPNQNILFARIIVVIMNVPVMIVATQKYTILQLFLVANMLTTCWFLPLLAGLWDVTTDFVGESGAVFGGSISILTSLAYSSGILWDRADSPSQAITCGTWYAWWGAYTYDWDQFMVAAGASVAGMLIWGIPKYILKKYFNIDGPGISGLLMRIPGYRFLAGGGLDFDLMNAIGLGRFNRTASERSESDPEVELAMDDAKQPNPAFKGELPVAEKPVVA